MSATLDVSRDRAPSGRSWLRKHPRARGAEHLLGCFLSVMLAVVTIVFFQQSVPGGSELLKNNITGSNPIWVANGVLLAYLLLAPRWRWPVYLAVGALALTTGNIITHEPWRMNLLYNFLDITEVLAGAHWMRGRAGQLPCFTDFKYLMRFLGIVVLALPLAISILFAFIMAWWVHLSLLQSVLSWACSESLGFLVITPICVAIFQSNSFDLRRWRQSGFLVALTALCSIGAFSFDSIPLCFFIYPLLVLVSLRAGLGWSALTLLLVAITGSWYTLRGQGIFAALMPITLFGPIVLLQLFIAVAMFMLYSVSMVVDRQKESERSLRKIVSLHNLVVDNSRDAILLSDLDGNITFVSLAGPNHTGFTREEILTFNFYDLIHPDDRFKTEAKIQGLQNSVGGVNTEERIRRRDGSYFWSEASHTMIHDPITGRPSGLLSIFRDVTERKLAEQAREFQSSLIQAIQNVSPSGILVVNGEGRVVSTNNRLASIWSLHLPMVSPGSSTESSSAESDWIHGWRLLEEAANQVKDRQPYIQHAKYLYAHPELDDESMVELKSGRTLERYSTSLRGEAGQYLGRVWFFNDITERKQAEGKLQDAYRTVEALAMTDALTGIANRRCFDHHLSNEWRRARRECLPLSLLMIDADWFKLYNDTFGHLRGDSCLKQIAEAIQDVVERPGDLVARFGGEEFAIILPNTPAEGALQVANHICASLRARQLPHASNPPGIVTVSIGCATMAPSAGKHAAHLVELADKALYKAKQQGRNQVCGVIPGN